MQIIMYTAMSIGIIASFRYPNIKLVSDLFVNSPVLHAAILQAVLYYTCTYLNSPYYMQLCFLYQFGHSS